MTPRESTVCDSDGAAYSTVPQYFVMRGERKCHRGVTASPGFVKIVYFIPELSFLRPHIVGNVIPCSCKVQFKYCCKRERERLRKKKLVGVAVWSCISNC
jgi:hypothetical protein